MKGATFPYLFLLILGITFFLPGSSPAEAEEKGQKEWPLIADLRPDLLVPPDPYWVPIGPRVVHDKPQPVDEQPRTLRSRLSDKGKQLRGLYLTTNYILKTGADEIARILDESSANAVIIDTKDDLGRIVYSTSVAQAKPAERAFIGDLAGLVRRLHEKDKYVIGRIVSFKDPIAGKNSPSWTAQDRNTGKTWTDHAGVPWLDPCNREAQDYIIQIAREIESLGFDEVQLDYIRFPVDDNARNARFAACGKTPRVEATADFVKKVRESIRVPLSLDVFGLTTYTEGDPNGLGQSLEHFAPYVDAISPMLYMSNFPRRYWQKYSPERVYSLIYSAVTSTQRRMGPNVVVRPLLQAFNWRVSEFGVPFIANQIAAARAAGASGFLLWNQFANYDKAFHVLRGIQNGELLLMASGLWNPKNEGEIVTRR